MVATQTRRPPNAFNLLRQVTILQRAGGPGAAQQFEAPRFGMLIIASSQVWQLSGLCFHRELIEDWENTTAVAKAFKIGRMEANAVSQIVCGVHKEAG